MSRAGDPGRVTFGSLETVGRGGALLRCEKPIPTTTDAEVTICLAGGVIRARARVLYHLPHEDGLAIGVEFLDLSDDSADLLDHLVSWHRNETWREHAPRCERWPFLLFGPPGSPGQHS